MAHLCGTQLLEPGSACPPSGELLDHSSGDLPGARGSRKKGDGREKPTPLLKPPKTCRCKRWVGFSLLAASLRLGLRGDAGVCRRSCTNGSLGLEQGGADSHLGRGDPMMMVLARGVLLTW